MNKIYAETPYGQIDAGFCDLINELLTIKMRSDVRRSSIMVALTALTRCWPSNHFPVYEQDKWSYEVVAAFQMSERELAELCGFSHQRVRSALKALRDAGLVIELAPAKPRGEGRGTAPTIYAFKCHEIAEINKRHEIKQRYTEDEVQQFIEQWKDQVA